MNRSWIASVRPTLMCLLMALLLTACASQKVLVQGMTQIEANEIEALLSDNGVEAMKQREEAGAGAQTEVLYSILVSRAEYTRANKILLNHGLPRPKGRTLLSVFGEGGLVPSETEEKIKVQAGRQAELERTIRSMEGILDVSVQLALPEEETLTGGEQRPGRAAVVVQHRGSLDDPNKQLKAKIRRFVADSVDIPLENVTVVDLRSEMIAGPAFSGSGRGEGEKEYSQVWTVIVANESVGRFQMIFFTMSMLALVSGLLMIWMIWRFLPVIRRSGGISSLFSMEPLALDSSGAAGEGAGDDEAKATAAAETEPDEDEDDDEDEEDEEKT